MNKYWCLLIPFFLTVCFADPPNWSVNPPDFEYDGSITAEIIIDGQVMGGENDMIAAFYGGECRGVAYSLEFPPTSQYVFMLMIFSNAPSGEVMSCMYYRHSNDSVYDITETISFYSNMNEGSAPDPVEFNLEAPTLEINSITIENVDDVSLGNHAYENQTTNISISIYNPESNTSNQLVLGIIYNWLLGEPPSTDADYDILLPIPPINPLSTITLTASSTYSISEDIYGQKPVSARVDPIGVGGDFYSWILEDSFIGWVQNSTINGYGWPVPAGSNRRITSVPNEYRGSGGHRIHQGIDITAPAGSDIVSVSSGKIDYLLLSASEYSNYVTLVNYDNNSGTGFRFYHLSEAAGQPLSVNDWIYSAGDLVANVFIGSGPHIHLEDFTRFGIDGAGGTSSFSVNPLRVNGLNSPWSDNPDTNPPVILDEFMVLTNGLNPQIAQGNIFGYQEAVDFVVFAKDLSPSGARMGLASISFKILDGSGAQVFPATPGAWETRVDLYTTPDDTNYYQRIAPTPVPYMYCYTECGDSGGDPYVDGSGSPGNEYVRYFITNDITDPRSGSFSGYFQADEHGMTFQDYELVVKVVDYSGNPATQSFLLPINETGYILGEK